MSPKLPAQPAAYQACLEEARSQAPLMAKRWYTKLLLLLFEKSTAAVVVFDKNKMHDAWLALKKHQADIEQGFSSQISRVIDREVGSRASLPTGRSRDAVASTSSTLRFKDLELMGDEQVQDRLDEARLTQTLLLTSESALTGLSARLSTVLGFKVVKADKNPLRPEVYANALVHALQDLPVDIEIRTRWLVHGGQIMGELLQAFYVQLDELLQRQGVKPAGYAVVLSPDDPRRTSQWEGSHDTQTSEFSGGEESVFSEGFESEPISSQPQQPSQLDFFRQEQLLTLDHLHRLMSGDYNDSFVNPQAPQVGEKLGLSQSDNSKRPTRGIGQSLAAEVVGLMIEQLTADQRLLSPVRQLLTDIKPAFLRLAAADPSFFSNKNHPARSFLEAMTARSLAFASESDEGFVEFVQDIQVCTNQLTSDKTTKSLDFAAALKGFEDRQAERNQVIVETQKLAVKALMQAEQRNLLAEKIALEIRERSDFVAGNPIISAFVTGPWAQVMAHERLTVESDVTAKRKAVFSLALGDLLWSANVDQASRHRKWLLKMIPDMTGAVHDGLKSIDYPLSLSKPFFEELMRLHEQALRSSGEKGQADHQASQTLAAAKFPADAPNSQRPWLQSAEAKQSGFMDFSDAKRESSQSDSEPMLQLGISAESQVNADIEDTQPMRIQDMLDLQLGNWVELVADNQWLRAQLSWISPHGTLFMFTGGDGHCHSMTALILKELVEQGRFRFISREGLLESALDGVAQLAMRNSVQSRFTG